MRPGVRKCLDYSFGLGVRLGLWSETFAPAKTKLKSTHLLSCPAAWAINVSNCQDLCLRKLSLLIDYLCAWYWLLEWGDTNLNTPDKSSKSLYSALVLFKIPPISSQRKWNDIFPLQGAAQDDCWKSAYRSPYKATRDAKYQNFHFKITYCIIPCNKYLSNIRIKQDARCYFCADTDTLQHFLLDCHNTNLFWRSVCDWLATSVNLHLHLSPQLFPFGVPPTVPSSSVINLITLFTKFCIYRQKTVSFGLFLFGAISTRILG